MGLYIISLQLHPGSSSSPAALRSLTMHSLLLGKQSFGARATTGHCVITAVKQGTFSATALIEEWAYEGSLLTLLDPAMVSAPMKLMSTWLLTYALPRRRNDASPGHHRPDASVRRDARPLPGRPVEDSPVLIGETEDGVLRG